jgi:KipI family sensor histidine kinase inhibitor
MPRFPRILPLGDCGVTIEFGERIDPKIHERVLACMSLLEQEPLPGQLDIVPTYRSVTIYFDPVITDTGSLGATLLSRAVNYTAARPRPSKTLTLPVFYDPAVAPDLEAVAAETRLTAEEVITLHTSVAYRVYMLGFTPGFPYLGLVPRRIAVPRLATPRTLVPVGSVGIAGSQTGIYPRDSPGGWRIIGRTPVQVCDLSKPEPFLLEPGDQVRFVAIDRPEYDELS